METTPPFPVVSGQRQLAVIMFTDAVGYSSQMHAEEVATLNRLERDTQIIRQIVEGRSGLVLKSTGDGLLIQFASAVAAMECALGIQRRFAERPVPDIGVTVLRHRIGVHLGDVFVGNNDVMGDGVNIAARLVGRAEPGGICLSQTVYDVVKNKLPLDVVRLGPQQLKNIKDPIMVYKVLLDTPRLIANPLAPLPSVPPAPTPVPVPVATGTTEEPRPQRAWLILLVLLGLGGATWLVLHTQSAHEEELGKSQSAQAALGALLEKTPATDPGEQAVPALPAKDDFASLVSKNPALSRPNLTPEEESLVSRAEVGARAVLAWLPTGLERYTRDRPLQVRGLGNPGFAGATVFSDASHQLFFAEGGAYRRRPWEELKDPVLAALIVAVLVDAPLGTPPEIRQGAEAFAYLRGMPEMIVGLNKR